MLQYFDISHKPLRLNKTRAEKKCSSRVRKGGSLTMGLLRLIWIWLIKVLSLRIFSYLRHIPNTSSDIFWNRIKCIESSLEWVLGKDMKLEEDLLRVGSIGAATHFFLNIFLLLFFCFLQNVHLCTFKLQTSLTLL